MLMNRSASEHLPDKRNATVCNNLVDEEILPEQSFPHAARRPLISLFRKLLQIREQFEHGRQMVRSPHAFRLPDTVHCPEYDLPRVFRVSKVEIIFTLDPARIVLDHLAALHRIDRCNHHVVVETAVAETPRADPVRNRRPVEPEEAVDALHQYIRLVKSNVGGAEELPPDIAFGDRIAIDNRKVDSTMTKRAERRIHTRKAGNNMAAGTAASYQQYSYAIACQEILRNIVLQPHR